MSVCSWLQLSELVNIIIKRDNHPCVVLVSFLHRHIKIDMLYDFTDHNFPSSGMLEPFHRNVQQRSSGKLASPSMEKIRYSNNWAVEIHGGSELADQIATRFGFINLGQVI